MMIVFPHSALHVWWSELGDRLHISFRISIDLESMDFEKNLS